MNVWLVKIGEILPIKDGVRRMRTSMLADKLIERGHEVLWWTSAFDHFNKKWTFHDDTKLTMKNGLKIYALKGFGYKKNISFERVIDHKIIARKFKRLASGSKPDIIIVSMPPHDLAYEVIVFAKKNNVPVLMDIRDPWPDLFLDHFPYRLKKMARIALYRDFQLIRKAAKMADGLIAVTPYFLEWGLRYAGRNKTWIDRVFYLGCEKSDFENDLVVHDKFSDLKEILEQKFIILFIGTLSKSYHNPLVFLELAERLTGFNDVHLIIAGDGELFGDIKRKSEKYSNLTLTGWLNKNEIEFLLRYSNIGICPSKKAVNLPTNKVYAYFSAGLPVVSAFQGDVREIIEKYEVGFYYEPNDIDALLNSIIVLYKDRMLYKKMSKNSRMVFTEIFDARRIYKEYVQHIEMVENEYRRKALRVILT